MMQALIQLQIGVSALLALLVSIMPLAGGAGRQIAFESDRDGNWEIYLMDVERRLAVNLTRSPYHERSPAWSSDGASLAYYSTPDNALKGNIYIMEVPSRATRPFTTDGESNWMPSWSPDGKWIAYVVNYGDMLIANLDGGDIHQLGRGFRPSWSPDSRRVIYFAAGENELRADVYDITIDGLVIRNLSRHYANDFDPAWSPDGKWIAFASEREGYSNIFVMPDCGEGDTLPCSQSAQAVTRNMSRNLSPAWSPDSQQIAYTDISGGNSRINVVNRDGSDLHSITASSSNNRLPAWRPS
jgi:TolB protein